MSVSETFEEDEDIRDQTEDDESEDDEDDEDEGEDASEDGGADDDGDDDESELSQEDKRERRRRERRKRRERQKAAEAADKRRIEQLERKLQESEQRLQSIEGSVTSSDMARLDEAINRYDAGIRQLRQQWTQAIEEGDGQKASELDERIYRARSEKEHMERVKHARTQAPRRQPVQQVDPSIVNNAKSWMAKNSWYSPNSSDPDSRYVDALDDQMVAEGWDPADPSYWKELSSRVRERLPHRFEAERRKAGRSRMAGGDRASPNRSGGERGSLQGVPEVAIQQWREAGFTKEEILKAAADFRKANRR